MTNAAFPLYFNDEMSPDLVGEFDQRVPQRRQRFEERNS